jgi:serine/threonine-protein kinase RsbW
MRQTATQPPPAGSAGPIGPWAQTFPGTPDQLRHVRAALRAVLADFPAVDDVILLTSELCANAVLHSGSGRPGGTFTVRLHHDGGRGVHAEVQDQGSTWDGNLRRAARQPHGLRLVLDLADECGADPSSHACTVWFRIDGPAARRAAPG